MRARFWVWGPLGLLCGCFVDPGNVTVGGGSGGGSSGTGSTTSGVVTSDATTTGGSGSTGAMTEPTSSETSTGAVGSTTAGSTTVGSTTEVATETTASTSTGDPSTGGVELPVPGCVPLFFTDFSEDPAAVLETVGEWGWDAKQGVFAVHTQDVQASMATTKDSWKDAVVYARVRVSSGTAVLRTRYDGAPNNWTAYFGLMQPSADKLQMGRTVVGQTTLFQTPTVPTEFDVWYTLTLAVQGNALSFGIDNQVLAAVKDGLVQQGRASIGAFGAGTAEFDWFLVCVAD